MAAQGSSAQWRSGTGSCQNEEGQQQRNQESAERNQQQRQRTRTAAAATSGGVAGVGGVSGWMGRTHVRVLGISFRLRHAGDPTQRASGKSEPVGTAWLHQVWWTGEG